MYYQAMQQTIKVLNNLSALMDKAVEYADHKKFDVANILNARLAPDQFSFIRQVQMSSDNAKSAYARLAGKEAPKFEDTEQTVEELKARLNKTVDYLNTLTEEDFKDADTRKVTLPFMPGVYIEGNDYLREFAIPNFYFHYTTAYSILRKNGVDIGKRDFIGSANFKKIEE